MFNLEKTGNPTFEAVSVAEVKAHARIYTSADDSYIDTLRVAAREQVEKDLEVAIVGQAYTLHLDWWLDRKYYDHSYQYGYGTTHSSLHSNFPKVYLPIQPVLSVQGITYTDTNGDAQTL